MYFLKPLIILYIDNTTYTNFQNCLMHDVSSVVWLFLLLKIPNPTFGGGILMYKNHTVEDIRPNILGFLNY